MHAAEAAWRHAKRGDGRAVARPRDTLIIVAVFALALCIRLYRLDAEPIWLDEAASLGFARASWTALWSELRPHETNPVGYYVLLKLWIAIAGTSEFALRLPSAIASALCVAPLYWLCLRLFDRRTAVLAVLLLALAAIHVEYAQEARNYAIFFLLFLWALIAAARLAEPKTWGQTSRGHALLLGALGAGLVWMHGTGLIALAAIDVFVLGVVATRRGPWMPVLAPLVAANLVAGVLAAPALLTIWLQALDPHSAASWIARPTLASAGAVYAKVLGHAYLAWSRPWADAILVLGLIAATWSAARRKESRIFGLLAALAFVLVAFYGLSQKTPVLLPRTALFALALALPLVAYGLTRVRSRSILIAASVAALVPQAKDLVNYFAYGIGKEPWRDATAAAAAASGPGSALLISGADAFGMVAVAYYWPQGRAIPTAFVLRQPRSKLQQAFVAHAGGTTMIDPETVCPELVEFERIVVIHRYSVGSSRIVELRAALTARGASEGDPTVMGNLDLRVWAGLTCPAAQPPEGLGERP